MEFKGGMVVTFDGMFGKNGFRPKELAVATITDTVSFWNCHIEPSCLLSDLPPSARWQNTWLQTYLHGLHFDYGEVTLANALVQVKSYTDGASGIWVLGNDDREYLSYVLTTPSVKSVLNMRQQRLPEVRSAVTCLAPVHVNGLDRFTCATNRAVKLAKQLWLCVQQWEERQREHWI